MYTVYMAPPPPLHTDSRNTVNTPENEKPYATQLTIHLVLIEYMQIWWTAAKQAWLSHLTGEDDRLSNQEFIIQR